MFILKRLLSLLFICSFFWTATAQANGNEAVIRIEASLYEAIDESVVLITLAPHEQVDVIETAGTHSRITIGETEGYVRNDVLAYPVDRYIRTDTNAVDAAGNPITPLSYGTVVKVFDFEGDRLLMTDGAYVAREALAETLETSTRYAKPGANVLATPGGNVALTLESGAMLTVHGIQDDHFRIKLENGYGFVPATMTSPSPVKTGTQVAVTGTTTFSDLGTTAVGQLVRGTRSSVYGTSGDYSRLYKGGMFVYVQTAALAEKMPTYAKTGSRYAQGEASLYRDVDKTDVVGKLKRSQIVSIYGSDGEFTRIFTNGQFLFVESKWLKTTPPPFLKTGQRYIQKETPLYTGASLSTKTNFKLKRGQLVNVYGTSGNYTRVSSNGKFYFVPTNLTSTKKPPLYDSSGKRYVRHDEVEVYASASTVKQVAELRRGLVVETYGTSGYYTRVRVNGAYRFVATGYLSLTKPLAKPKVGTVFYAQFNGTPYFSADVAYSRPAGTLARGTKLIGLRSIDADFWHVRLPSGKRVYVLNPYIAETKPKAIQPTNVNPVAHYATMKQTPYYANPNDTHPIGYLDASQRVYPRGKSGDSYLTQYSWRPVYVKMKDIRIKQDPLLTKRSNSQQERMIAAAARHLGTPYTWGSQSPLNGGFDCSGLIHYATNQAGKIGGRTNVSGYWHSGHFKNKRTGITSGRRGDIVFFAGTYRSGPSHIGIMLDNEFFIHAGGEMLQINSIHDPMWRSNFLGYKSL
ncbi:nlpC/P60 family protein [Exiguobacterium sp. S17]|nr:nlpC/P60 family protein [Exiguobacterium sp. S17]